MPAHSKMCLMLRLLTAGGLSTSFTHHQHLPPHAKPSVAAACRLYQRHQCRDGARVVRAAGLQRVCHELVSSSACTVCFCKPLLLVPDLAPSEVSRTGDCGMLFDRWRCAASAGSGKIMRGCEQPSCSVRVECRVTYSWPLLLP